MNLKKYFLLIILVVFMGSIVILSAQIISIYQISQKRDAAKAEYYQSEKEYRKAEADSTMSKTARTDLKIKLHDQRYTYKFLKYERLAQIAWMKVVIAIMFLLGMISYNMRKK